LGILIDDVFAQWAYFVLLALYWIIPGMATEKVFWGKRREAEEEERYRRLSKKYSITTTKRTHDLEI